MSNDHRLLAGLSRWFGLGIVVSPAQSQASSGRAGAMRYRFRSNIKVTTVPGACSNMGNVRRSWRLPAMLGALLLGWSPAVVFSEEDVDRMSLDERVACELSIQAVYARHRDESEPSVEDQVRQEARARKTTERRLAMDRALSEVWNMRLTPEVVAGELDRIGRDTRRPDMLAELIEALNHDPVLLGECLARPLITERRFHLLYQHDAEIHASTRMAAEAGREALVHGISPDAARARPLFSDQERSEAEDWLAGQSWFRDADAVERHQGEVLSPVIETERGFQVIRVAVSDGAVADAMVHLWSKAPYQDWLATRPAHGEDELFIAAGAEHPELDSWAERTQACSIGEWVGNTRETDPMISKEPGEVEVWTGTEMLIWGLGRAWNAAVPRESRIGGALYNPTTDSWRVMTEVGQPSLERTSAVWTGTELIIWGGCKFTGGTLLDCNQRGGYRYSPDSDEWQPISQEGAPQPTVRAPSVWTGQEMIVYSGCGNAAGNIAAYDPMQDAWRALPPAPMNQGPDGAVWTGSEMIVFAGWAGQSGSCYGTGALTSRIQIYNPTTEQWRVANDNGAPLPLTPRKAVWTGQEVIVWGGRNLLSETPVSGGMYNESEQLI